MPITTRIDGDASAAPNGKQTFFRPSDLTPHLMISD